MIEVDTKNRVADYFDPHELVELLGKRVSTEDIIEAFEDDVEDILDDLEELMEVERE